MKICAEARLQTAEPSPAAGSACPMKDLAAVRYRGEARGRPDLSSTAAAAPTSMGSPSDVPATDAADDSALSAANAADISALGPLAV